jgi:hypothetical protein
MLLKGEIKMFWIQEIITNETKNCCVYESDVYETDFETKKDLFFSLQKENGKCLGFVYQDLKNGETKKTGWIFQKKAMYTDCNETYIRNTWISLHAKEPKTTIEYFPIYL